VLIGRIPATPIIIQRVELGRLLELLFFLMLVLDEQLIQIILETLLPHQIVLFIRQATIAIRAYCRITSAIVAVVLFVLSLVTNTRIINVATATRW